MQEIGLGTAATPYGWVNNSNARRFQLAIGGLLRHIAEALELTPKQHAQAVSAYTSVAKHLTAPASPFAPCGIEIYPQGGMAAGLTVRPLQREEFDLDVMMQLLRCPLAAMALLQAVFDYLRTLAEFADICELRDRCVRLNYSGSFHLDMVAGYLDARRAPTGILIPDRTMRGWKPSNPRALLGWFRQVAVPGPRDGWIGSLDSRVEPPPSRVSPSEKLPLQIAIQILKRARDVHFQKQPALATPSIILMVLGGLLYDGSADVGETYVQLVDSLARYASELSEPPTLWNPADQAELISEKWLDEPAAWAAFKSWIVGARSLLESQQAPTQILEALVGRSARDAGMRRQADAIRVLSSNGQLSVSATGALAQRASVASPRPAARRHTFYGEE